MSKKRLIDTRFWDDGYITELDPIEKLLFLYFITNPLTSITGCYEIGFKRIAYDTGIDSEMVKKIVDRFSADGKIIYKNGYIIVCNFVKYQNDNPNIRKGFVREYNELPDSITESLSKPLEGYINTLKAFGILKPKLKPTPKLKPKLNTPLPPKGEIAINGDKYLERWKEITNTTLRSKLPENIKAADRLLKQHGPEFLRDMLQTIRIIRADRYAGKQLHLIANYIELEKHLELVEQYKQGLADSRQFQDVINHKEIVSV